MGDILVSLIIVGVTAIGIIALFIFLGQKKKQTFQQLEQSAKENGWILERIEKPLLSGYKVSGRMMEGNWTLESLSKASSTESGPGSSGINKTTEWFSSDLISPKGAVVFGPAMGPVSRMSNTSFGSTLVQMALRIMLGQDAEWAGSLSQTDISNTSMGKKLIAFATEGFDVKPMITPEVEKAVGNLSGKMEPVIIWNQNGISIRFLNHQSLNPEEWKIIIELGKTLMREWSRIG